MKEEGSGLLSTIGSLSLCRSLLRGGLVDRFRVVMFPVITGATGSERIYDGYPDIALDMLDSRTFDGRIQLVEYRPRVLDHPPLATASCAESELDPGLVRASRRSSGSSLVAVRDKAGQLGGTTIGLPVPVSAANALRKAAAHRAHRKAGGHERLRDSRVVKAVAG